VPVCAPGQTTNCPTEAIVFTVPVNTLVNDEATAYVNIPSTGSIKTNDVVPAGTTYGTPVADPTNPAAGSGGASSGAVLTMTSNGTYTFIATVAGTYTYTVAVCAPGQTIDCPSEIIVFTVKDTTSKPVIPPVVLPPVVPPVVLPPVVPPIITKILDVTKVAGSAVLNLDGTFDLTFTIKAYNLTNNFIDSVLLKDDLTKVFDNTNGIKVVSVATSGGLVRNANYDGISNTDLVTISSSLDSSKVDSVLLRINVPSTISGNFQNTVIGSTPTVNGLLTTLSTDPTRILSANDTVRKPTLFVIPKVPLNIPEGFSPNNDGIDDTWVIRRPMGTKVSVWVINRWGNEVYKNMNYNNDWRGKGIANILGEDLPEGTYYYIVHGTDVDGKLQKLAGSLTIKR
jgi:gliding motility-associated-like protein